MKTYFLLLLVCSSAAACTDPSVGSDAGVDAAGEADADSGAVDSGGVVDAPITHRSAQILMVSGPGGGAKLEGANFWDAMNTTYLESSGTPVATACTVTRIGACARQECSTQTSGSARSAGAVTLSTDSGQMVTLPAGSGPGASYSANIPQTSATWREGNLVHFAATGGADVPGFAGTVACPSSLSLRAPANASTVSRTADLQVQFAALGHGDARVVVNSPDGPFNQVVCVFPGASGSGTIPAALLGGLSAGQTSVQITGYATANVVAGDWSVSLVAEVNSIGGSTSITLQ